MFEHRHVLETQQRSRRTPFGVELDVYHRFVCSCGNATSWRRDLKSARKERDRHAFDGQLADPAPIVR